MENVSWRKSKEEHDPGDLTSVRMWYCRCCWKNDHLKDHEICVVLQKLSACSAKWNIRGHAVCDYIVFTKSVCFFKLGKLLYMCFVIWIIFSPIGTFKLSEYFQLLQNFKSHLFNIAFTVWILENKTWSVPCTYTFESWSCARMPSQILRMVIIEMEVRCMHQKPGELQCF